VECIQANRFVFGLPLHTKPKRRIPHITHSVAYLCPPPSSLITNDCGHTLTCLESGDQDHSGYHEQLWPQYWFGAKCNKCNRQKNPCGSSMNPHRFVKTLLHGTWQGDSSSLRRLRGWWSEIQRKKENKQSDPIFVSSIFVNRCSWEKIDTVADVACQY